MGNITDKVLNKIMGAKKPKLMGDSLVEENEDKIEEIGKIKKHKKIVI